MSRTHFLTLVFALISTTILSAQKVGVGNGRDLRLQTRFVGQTYSDAAKPLANAVVEVVVTSPGQTLVGAPIILVGELQVIGQEQIIWLENEWFAFGVGVGLTVIADGTHSFPAILPGLPVVEAGGTTFNFPLPSPSQLSDGMAITLQALTLDANALNGLAVTPAVRHHTELFPIADEETGIAHGRDAILGYRVAGDDLNGDGYQDLVVSVGRADPNGVLDAGAVEVRFGPNQSIVQTLTASVPVADALFGSALATGDVTGDGIADLVVGSMDEDVNGLDSAGAVYVFGGPNLSQIARLESPLPAEGADFGHSVATLDWNGDGFMDVAVSASKAPGAGLVKAGQVYLFLAPTFETVLTFDDPTPQISGRFGYNIEGGDLNGDGLDDLVIGAAFADAGPGDDNSGELHVFDAATGSAAPVFTYVHPLDESAFFGHAIEIADMDADGNLDLIVGAEFADAGAIGAGEVVILYGPTFASVVSVPSPQISTNGGFGSDVAVGDANGDGYPDLIVGEFYATVQGLPRAGRGWLIFGPYFETSKELAPSTPQAYSQAGRRVGCCDLNGDGMSSPVLGAPFASPGGAINHNAGLVVVFE